MINIIKCEAMLIYTIRRKLYDCRPRRERGRGKLIVVEKRPDSGMPYSVHLYALRNIKL